MTPRRTVLVLATWSSALALAGCGGSATSGDAGPATSAPASVPSTAAATEPSPSPTPVDLAALIESVPGFTYGPAPEVEEAIAAGAPPGGATDELVVRAIARDGQPQGTVILQSQEEITDDERRDSLAGALNGGGKTGTATREELAGLSAVKVVRPDGGTTWFTVKGRYTVTVGALPEVAEDLTVQLLDRLPA